MAISYSDYKKEWKNGIGKEIDKLKTEYAKQQQNSVNTNNTVEDKKAHALATSTVVNPKIFELNTEKEKKEKAYQEYKNNLNNNVIFKNQNPTQNRLNELATRQMFERVYDSTKINKLNQEVNQYEDKLTLGKIGKTAGNIATNMAVGTLRASESFLDWSTDMSNKVNDGLAHKLGILTDEEYENTRKNTREFISRNLVDEGLAKLGWDEEMYEKWEKDSYVKRDNLGGEVSQGIGGMFPSLVVGNVAGLNPSAVSNSYKSLQGLTLGQKILTGTTNVGKAMLYTLPTNTTLGLKVYGSALEEAYNSGATDSEATRYAIASSAKEIATEWLTSGIPGLEQTGLLDKGADFLIDKATGKITEEATKGIVKSLLKAGYEMVGEGLEEGISEILTPIIKNATYSEGEQIDWGAVVNSIIVGSITGGILNVPSTIYNVQNAKSTISNSNTDKLTNNNQIQVANINEINNQNAQTTNNNQIKLPDNPIVNDNVQIDKLNFVESAKLYNLDSNSQVILRINELLDNRGITGRFDGTKFNDTSIDAYWSIDKNGNRSVIFNPKAKTQNYIQNVAIHELTHDLLSSRNTEEMLNTKEILEYISTKEGYIEARNSLIKDYSEVYDQNNPEFQNIIDEEVIASVFGNKLGTQEFVDQLVYEKPLLAKRIYNWIVDKLNSLVNSGKVRSERLYWENIRNKFEKSYKMEYNNTTNESDIKMSIYSDNAKYKTKTLNSIVFEKAIQTGETHFSVRDANNYYIINNAKDGNYDIFKVYRIEGNEDFLNNLDKLRGDYNVNRDGTNNSKHIKRTSDRLGINSGYNANVEGEQSWTEFIDSVLETVGQEKNNNQRYSIKSRRNNTELENSSFSFDNQGRKLSKQQQEFFKDSKVRDENGNLLTYYNGSGDFTVYDKNKMSDISKWGKGIYLTKYEDIAHMYGGNVKELYVNITNPISQTEKTISFKQYNDLYKTLNDGEDGYREEYDMYDNDLGLLWDMTNKGSWADFSEQIKEYTGKDGLIINNDTKAEDMVIAFNSNQVKNVDNTNPTTNDDIRYSQNTNDWQGFVDKNFKTEGTGQTISDLKQKEQIKVNISNTEDSLKDYIEKKSAVLLKELSSLGKNKKVSKNLKLFLESGITVNQLKNTLKTIKTYPLKNTSTSHIEKSIRSQLNSEYEKHINNVEEEKTTPIEEKIKNNDNTIEELKLKQKETLDRLDQKIKDKEELYNSKKNKDTKIAQQIQQQITLLNNQKNNRKMEYDQRITKLTEVNENLKEKANTPEFKTLQQRMNKINEYRDLAYIHTLNMIDWKDKKRGISYQINTMKRNLYDVMSYDDATKMYNTYFKPITENNAKIEKFINSYNTRIKKLNLNNIESTAVQMLGEYKYNKETLLTGPQVDEFISQNKLDYKKLNNAVQEFRKIYDELIVKTNEVLIEQGYKPIEYRKGYFPHFVEEKPETKLGKVLEKIGFKIKKDSLPTDIAGITDTFRPGKTWFKHSQRRIGKYTDYNVLKGFDAYIRGAADTIYHTEDIQKLRALENVIRFEYTDQAIQDKITEINEDPILSYDEKIEQFDELMKRFNNPLGNFVTEIKNYTDSLANKKSVGDRSMEHMLGRETYSIMSNIQSRVSANMVAFNISSALTNFIPITQAYSQISNKNMLKAIRESVSAQHISDNVSKDSVFLTNRNHKADRLYKTTLDVINDKGSFMFEAVDDFTSNVIVRGKLYENLDKGMSYQKALENADEFARDIMAGRDKGSMPTIFNRKNPIVKLFTAFQLEVNNQYGYMLKDLPRDKRNEGLNKLVGAFVKMFIGSWLYNKVVESLTGRKSAFSPIDIVSDAIRTTQNDNLNAFEKLSKITEDAANELPFIGGLLNGGRLPISSALPEVSTTIESMVNLLDDSKRKNALNTLKKELSKPLFYVIPPFGGGQLKKTIEGASMYINKDIQGSYTTSGRLRFEADKSIPGVAKSLVFGQYASKNAKEYLPLTEKQQKEIKELGITVKEYRKYREDYAEINKIKSDKNEVDNSIPESAAGKKAFAIMKNQEMDIKEKNYLLSTISNNSIVTVDMLNKLEHDEDVYKYFYSLNNENKKEFIEDLNTYAFDSKQLYEYYNYRNETRDGYVPVIAKQRLADYLLQSNLNDEQKKYLYAKEYANDTLSKTLKHFNVSGSNYINVSKYSTKLKDDFPGTNYSDYRKQATFNYINNLNATTLEKIVLFKVAGYSISSYKNDVFNYVNSLNLTKAEKEEIFNYLY